jgi:3,4-dihydroxy 2-butanone 4-phosphate synthase/GTP cyclohydrolase II
MIPDSYFEEYHQAAQAHHARTGRPLVTLSYAQSLDGSIARRRGESLPLSGPEALAFTHRLRSCHDAILVGIGTVLADDPRLTARGTTGPDPQPVVLDSTLRLPPDARLWAHPRGPWIFASAESASKRSSETSERGGRLFVVRGSAAGGVDLAAVLDCLGAQSIASVMVEGGAAVITSFLAEGLADRMAMTIAPVFVGGLRAPEALQEMMPVLTDVEMHRLGKDVLLTGSFARG